MEEVRLIQFRFVRSSSFVLFHCYRTKTVSETVNENLQTRKEPPTPAPETTPQELSSTVSPTPVAPTTSATRHEGVPPPAAPPPPAGDDGRARGRPRVGKHGTGDSERVRLLLTRVPGCLRRLRALLGARPTFNSPLSHFRETFDKHSFSASSNRLSLTRPVSVETYPSLCTRLPTLAPVERKLRP